MDFLGDDQDNAQRVLDFWQKNRYKIYVALFISILSFCIYTYWEYEVEQRHQASLDHYTSFISSLNEGDNSSVTRASRILKERFPRYPYTSLALMRFAQFKIQNEEFGVARETLDWLIENAFSQEIKILSKIKLAQLYLHTKKFEDSLKILEEVDSFGLPQMVQDIKGDLYAQQGEWDQAIESYISSLNSTEIPDYYVEILTSKANTLYYKKAS